MSEKFLQQLMTSPSLFLQVLADLYLQGKMSARQVLEAIYQERMQFRVGGDVNRDASNFLIDSYSLVEAMEYELDNSWRYSG